MEIDYFLPIFIDYRPVPAKTGSGAHYRAKIFFPREILTFLHLPFILNRNRKI